MALDCLGACQTQGIGQGAGLGGHGALIEQRAQAGRAEGGQDAEDGQGDQELDPGEAAWHGVGQSATPT